MVRFARKTRKKDNPEETCQKNKKEAEKHAERDEAVDLGRI